MERHHNFLTRGEGSLPRAKHVCMAEEFLPTHFKVLTFDISVDTAIPRLFALCLTVSIQLKLPDNRASSFGVFGLFVVHTGTNEDDARVLSNGFRGLLPKKTIWT